ncbi:hypothetical protein [Micromonospora sp. NPDC002575]|uniref:hypothetical protein n=1 Tax=Micromonospora sp. NPDC002575 TaxID=3364222 RepID=UPI0036BF4EC9
MRTTTAAAGGRWGRLALLLCTLVGLAAMHTLGHGAHSGGTHAGHDGATPRDGHPAPAVHAEAAGVPGALVGGAGGAVAFPGSAGGGRADGPSGWSVCLAMLGALGVALLVAVLLLTGARAPGPPGRQAGGVPAGPRAPPPRPLGLRLAEVSVSRT